MYNDTSLNSINNKPEDNDDEDDDDDVIWTSTTPNISGNILTAKSKHVDIYHKLSSTVTISNNIKGFLEEILQKCANTYQYRNDASHFSTKDVVVIHPKQFDSITSSEHDESASTDTTTSQQDDSHSSSHETHSKIFKSFILQNLPSELFPELSRDETQTNINAENIRENGGENASFHDERNENRVGSRSFQQIQISPSIVPPRPIYGDPPSQGAPPSYSAVMRIGNVEVQNERLFGRRDPWVEPSPPFIAPVPPPTYAEAQGQSRRPLPVDSGIMFVSNQDIVFTHV